MSKRSALLSVLACMGAVQAASFNVPATAANLTAVAVDGKCNLTEAIQSVLSGPVNSDCVPYGGADRHVFLSGANTVFQVAANTTVWGDMAIYTTYGGQVIEAAGTPLRTLDGCVLTITATGTPLTIRVKSGSTGRAVYAAGEVVADNVIFQGGNVTGLSGDTYGGVIYSTQGLDLTDCTIQGGTAARGGGLYLTSGADLYNVIVQNNSATDAGGGIFTSRVGWTSDFRFTTIQNNTAAKRGGGMYMSGGVNMYDCSVKGNKAGQGGGIFHQWKNTAEQQPNLVMERSTLSGNKAIASEVTPIPVASGASASGTGTQCSGAETPSHAFDDSFGTKWCTTGANHPDNGANAVVLTYDFPGTTTQTVTAYSITTANDVPGRDPASWTFEGYNGSSWVVLHTVANWTRFNYPEPTSPAQRFFTESFNSEAFNIDGPGQPWPWRFTNTTAYQSYRLRITRNASQNTGTPLKITQLAELQLYLDGRTGDGGGLYSISRMFLKNGTISGNIAGCLNASCACAGSWCSTPSNTAPAMGKGGGVYAGNPAPESFISFMTVAGNSASQGGGAYQDQLDHWEWSWSLFGRNNARAGNAPEPDFHGNPHSAFRPRRSSFFQNTGGINVFNDDPNNSLARGLVLSGPERDYVGDPLINTLADNGGPTGYPHTQTHALQSGSTARDKAVSATTGEVPVNDQRGPGYPRHNGTSPDLGSYEF